MRTTVNRDLFVRRCVCCGYDGALLRDGRARRCVRCGNDLVQRPARSYAEMEGLVGIASPGAAPSARREASGAPATMRVVQHWLAFIFIVLMGVVLLAYLVRAAVP